MKFFTQCLSLLVLCFGTALSASSSPLVSIGEGGTPWNTVVAGPLPDGSLIQPVLASDGLTGAAQQFYTSQGSPFALVDSNISSAGSVELNGESHDALLMEWNPANPQASPDSLSIAAWEYVYGVDPDLSNMAIHFSVGVPGPPPTGGPPPIWDVSLELIDALGGSAGWFLPAPQTGWHEYWIKPGNPSNQGPFFYFEDPVNGFDVTQVVAIRLDEAGMNVQFPLPPSPGTQLNWNVWNHLRVEPMVPEPGTMALVVVSGVALLVRSKRRRRVG